MALLIVALIDICAILVYYFQWLNGRTMCVQVKGEQVPQNGYRIVEYGANNNKGNGDVVIEGVGIYGGTPKVYFTIKPVKK